MELLQSEKNAIDTTIIIKLINNSNKKIIANTTTLSDLTVFFLFS
jgi:hypothetical protein